MENSKNINLEIEYPKKGITSKSLFDYKNNDVTLFCMSADSKMSEHTSIKRGIIYVVEGDGEFILEKEKIKMSSGVTIFMKENAKHSLKANKNTSFILSLN